MIQRTLNIAIVALLFYPALISGQIPGENNTESAAFKIILGLQDEKQTSEG
jgi:hypothetical protein